MRRSLFCALAGALLVAGAPRAHAQPVTISRIEAMPALPPTYRLRDWKRVARQFDSLAFDPARTGPYLPLVRPYAGTANYPEHGSFALPSYVGGATATEAVAALPALVGASLVGIDKRAQFGQNWVLMAEEWFNRANGENVYLNNPQSRSGSDGWYDTMPNVFFYQLAALYPGTGHFDAQLRTVADRWLQAAQALGASTTPYRAATFNVRGVALRTMTPNRSSVLEPEMAGAVGWLLYSAYVRTGDARYRVGAEQCLDYLSGLTSNPSYELQLPYGALTAARLNAEVGTHYDVPKLVGWSFDRGPLRAWGTFVGVRGGLDLSGLVGEVDGDGYLFLLNGLQQAAALVPLVRYDDRLARPIGRWMVNLAERHPPVLLERTSPQSPDGALVRVGLCQRPRRRDGLRGPPRAAERGGALCHRRCAPQRLGRHRPVGLLLGLHRLPRRAHRLDRGAGHPPPRPAQDRLLPPRRVRQLSLLQSLRGGEDRHAPAQLRHLRPLRRRPRCLRGARRAGHGKHRAAPGRCARDRGRARQRYRGTPGRAPAASPGSSPITASPPATGRRA